MRHCCKGSADTSLQIPPFLNHFPSPPLISSHLISYTPILTISFTSIDDCLTIMLAFTKFMKTATVLVLAILAIASPTPIAVPRDDLAGVISAPAEGTVIAPGQAFDFAYGIHADYCSSSYNYSVWLMTEMPQAFSPSPTFMTGYLFGTYDAANYPGT